MQEKTYLELSEDTGSHKFYEVNIEDGVVTIRYGRIGTDGQKQVETLADFAAAKKFAEKKIAEKKKKGYEEAVMGVRKKRTITRRFTEAASSAGSSRSSAASTSKLPMPWKFASGSMAFGIFIHENGCWVGNQDGRVIQLSHEGEVVSQYKLPEGVKCLVADEHWIYAGCDDGNVYDLTGKVPRKAYEISEDVDIFWLDVNNGWLGVSDANGNVALFDYEGNESWRKKGKGDSAWMVRCNFDGKVFYGDSSGVACYNGTGTQEWFTKTGSVLFGYQDKFVLYAGTTSSNMVCLSKTGEILQTFKTDASVFSCAATTDGQRVFGGDNSGYIYCFDADGNRLWKMPTGMGSVLSMQYFKDNLYVVTSQGHLACVDVSEVAIEKANAGEIQKPKETMAPQAVAVAQTHVLETAPATTQGVRLQCVKDGSKLRVKVLSDGYHKDWFVQFPNELRQEGMVYVAEEIKEATQGGFYRVLGNIYKANV